MRDEIEQQAKSLFVSAIDMEPTERAAFLAARCGDDASLTRRVMRLLEAHEQAGPFLAEPPQDGDAATGFHEGPVGRGTLWRDIGRALDMPAPSAVLQSGDELSAYRIVSKLGAGGMGTVYVAELVRSALGVDVGQRVALKVIHPHLLEAEGFFKRFLREAQVGQKLVHENVVRTLDCDAVARAGCQYHFLVMEWVDGQTLRDLLRELDRVPEDLCRHIGREVANGLAAIHQVGAVHRDIKPDNILITPAHIVKVMDLGVAHVREQALRLSRTGAFVGSIEYAAPEQFHGREADDRTDLYSLGVTLYELSTGQHPHRSDNARQVLRRVVEQDPRPAGDVNPQLSPFFEEVIQALIAKDPDQRFASARELAQVFADGEAGPWWKARSQGLRLQTRKPLRRIRIPRETSLCGRDDDLLGLRTLFDAAKAEAGRVVLLEGEAGVGKTRLVDEFVSRLQQAGEDLSFLYGSHRPGGVASSGGAFAEAFREHFGEDGSSAYLGEAKLLAPAFDAFLRDEPQPEDALGLSRDSLCTCFVRATKTLAAERTTVLLIDDLHFASEDSRSLFCQLAYAVAGLRVLLIGTMRPGVPEGWIGDVSRLEHATHLSLGRLGPKDLTKLLVDAFQSERLAEELGFRIAHKSDGNPFFVFEIIRALREGQLLSQRPDGTWFRTSEIQDVTVPSSVSDLIQARLQDLSDEERELLDVAACVGFEFDPELVADVVGRDVVPTLRSLGRIETRHRLVRSAGPDLVFDHHQVQESLYAGLLERLRRRYHAAIAKTIESRERRTRGEGTRPDGVRCVQLCHHFLKGGCGARALEYLDAALGHLRQSFRNEQAVALAESALDASGLLDGVARLEVLLEMNDRLDFLGRRNAQEDVLAEALALAESAGRASLLRVERAMGALRFQTGRYADAERHYARCLELSAAIGDRRGEADATGNLGNVALFQGRYEEARAQCEHRLAIEREIGDQHGEVRAELDLAKVLTRLGHTHATQERLRHVEGLAREIGDRHAHGLALVRLTGALLGEGRYQPARQYAEQSLEVMRSIGYRRGEAVATGNLANVLHGLGSYDAARDYMGRWRRLTEEIGDIAGQAVCVGTLGQLLLAQGRLGEAHQNLERLLVLARELGERPLEARALGSLGDVHKHRGSLEEARTCLEQQLAISTDVGDPRQQAYALSRLGEIAKEDGDLDAAQRLLEDALGIRRALADVHVTSPLLALADIELMRGNRSGARDYLDEALEVARDHESGRAILLSTMRRARILEEIQDALDALACYEAHVDHWTRLEVRSGLHELTNDDVHLHEAYRLLEFALAHERPEHRRGMLEDVPLHARIRAAWDQRPPATSG